MTSPPVPGTAWPGTQLLVTDTRAPQLDLSAAVGQMSYTWRFELVDGVSGEHLGDVTPIRQAKLSHSTGMSIKRRLGLALGKADTAAVNATIDRINLFMIIPGALNPDRADGQWPLGRYMWSDNPRKLSTGGRLAQPTLNDEMFLVDTELSAGISGVGDPIVTVLAKVLEGLPIVFEAENSEFTSADAWGIGTTRGQILDALAVSGDYFSPWFDNKGVLRFVRTFNPANVVPDINFDRGYRIIATDIVETDELLTAPNRYIVISNAAQDASSEVVGIADIPTNAPNSIANLGYVRAKTLNLQLSDAGQAAAVARGLAERATVFEQINISTPADPRHDGYNVVRWQGENWLELAWSMDLVPGAPMVHNLRRSYGGAG